MSYLSVVQGQLFGHLMLSSGDRSVLGIGKLFYYEGD